MVDHRDILEALRNTTIPFDRRNGVRRSNSDKKRGMCLGYVFHYCKGWWASKNTVKDQKLSHLLCLFAAERFPDFKFSSIMVNSGSSALHVDKGNCGPSLIIAVGNHTGGKLWQYPGTELKVKNRLVECDGRLPHITLPFEGERYSVVYFNMKGSRPPAPESHQRILKKCGFAKPPRKHTDNGRPQTHNLSHAAKILKTKWKLSQKYIGDWKNTSFPKLSMKISNRKLSNN